ncbi:hypothetical protein ABPG72_013577 [Tetrahymena utriculariae]
MLIADFNDISYNAKLQQSDHNTGKRFPDIEIPLGFCKNLTNEPLIDPKAQCLGLKNLQQNQSQFNTFNGAGFDTVILIQIKLECNIIGQSEPCTTDLNILNYYQYLYGETASFFFSFKQKQFDKKKQQSMDKITTFEWDFDSTLITSSSITLMTAYTSVKDGFIVQKETNHLYLVDADNQDSFKAKGYSSRSDPLIVANFYIKLSQEQQQETIQYVQYPEILAQFDSIVNVLLIIGIIGVFVAKADIQQYFIDQKLKEYYRKTAYKILKDDIQSVHTNPKSFRNTTNSVSKVNKDEIFKIIKEIDNKDMNQEITQKFKISTLEKNFRILRAEQKEDYQKKKRSNKDLYENLFFEANKCSDIFELQSQLMQMKKKERNKYEKVNKKQSDEIENGEKIKIEIDSQIEMIKMDNLSHIEQIDQVDYDHQYFQNQLEKFFKSSEKGFENENQNTKQFNLRLLECLKKYIPQGLLNKIRKKKDYFQVYLIKKNQNLIKIKL